MFGRFTLVDAIALGLLLVVAGAILWPAQPPRGRRMQNNTQLRGIHQGMVTYAQGNNGHFPGLDHDGNIVAPTVEERFRILLDANFFIGDYAISPAETKTEWQAGPVTTANYSYAMLQIDGHAEGRRGEWYETLNTEAVVLSDRNLGSDGRDANVLSVWTTAPGNWRGGVVYNDNSTATKNSHRLTTRYAGSTPHLDDNLFEPADHDDAYLIHSGK